MKARLLKAASLDQLRTSVAANLEAYRHSGFGYLEPDSSFWFEHNVEVDLDALKELKAPSGGSFYEVENCEIVYSALKGLSPYDARDERFWVYLSHTALLDHVACCRFRGHQDWVFHEAGGGVCNDGSLGVNSRSRRFG